MFFSDLERWCGERQGCDGTIVDLVVDQHPCIRGWAFSTMPAAPGAWHELEEWCRERGIQHQDADQDPVWLDTTLLPEDLWEGLVEWRDQPDVPARYIAMGRWWHPREVPKYQLLVGFTRIGDYLTWTATRPGGP